MKKFLLPITLIFLIFHSYGEDRYGLNDNSFEIEQKLNQIRFEQELSNIETNKRLNQKNQRNNIYIESYKQEKWNLTKEIFDNKINEYVQVFEKDGITSFVDISSISEVYPNSGIKLTRVVQLSNKPIKTNDFTYYDNSGFIYLDCKKSSVKFSSFIYENKVGDFVGQSKNTDYMKIQPNNTLLINLKKSYL